MSCAACCGLYNVTDASEDSMYAELRRRSALMASIGRKVNDLLDFKEFIRGANGLAQLDPDIHVCEFIGFLDTEERTLGCLLHPCARGNDGVDLRGLCHYGAMACKSFYCPAWKDMPPRVKNMVAMIAPDSRAYGLLATDASFSLSMIRLLEIRLGHELAPQSLKMPDLKQRLSRLLSLKYDWPDARNIKKRISNYYFIPAELPHEEDALIDRILDSISFCYDRNFTNEKSRNLIRRELSGALNP